MMSRNRSIQILLVVALLGFTVSCVERTPLPTEIYTPDEFAAGDTAYLLQSPVWDASWGFETPLDISLSLDGHLFVADSAAQRIFVLGQDGELLEGFQALENLQTASGEALGPIDVDIDTKMNIFFIDGSSLIYRWNQYYNDMGLAAVSTAATFVNTKTNESMLVEQGSIEWLQIANHPDWRIQDIEWSNDPILLESFISPAVFYNGGNEINQYLDPYYNGDNSQFRAISSTEGSDRFIYAAETSLDEGKDRIIRIELARSHYLKLMSREYLLYDASTQYQDGSVVNYIFNGITFTYKWLAEAPATGFVPMDENGLIDHEHWELDDVLWTHVGIFGQTVAESGTGVGSVKNPTGLDIDYSGAIYYSQNSDYFSTNVISYSSDERYLSVFDAAQHDLMQISRFSNPQDIAVDNKQNIYIANTTAGEIQVFSASGNFYKSAGKGVLEEPVAVAVDGRGMVYICDLQSSSIIRYRLSNELDENVLPEDP